MGSYASADRQDRAKAMTGVALVHVALGAVILSGLDVKIVRNAVERMQTFDIAIPEPPPPPPPPEQSQEVLKAPEDASPAAPKASPVVAPEPEIKLPITLPFNAAPVPGTGSTSSIGRGGSGSGTGAGGSGAGNGGGGTGSFVPAQRVRRIPNSEYRRFVSVSGMSRGRVGVSVKVNTDGHPSNCRIVRSSGNSAADSLMCELTLRHVRFRPALDPQGRPVAQDMSWFPDWSPNR